MVVDAWPGRDEDKAGMPQLGEGGRLLRSVVTEACNRLGVDAGQVFYTYAARCKPQYGHEVTEAELEACLPWLVGEIDEIQPRVILALGKVAQVQTADALFDPSVATATIMADMVDAYSPTYILKNKSKLAVWGEQIEQAVRRAFSLPTESAAPMNVQPWEFGSPDMTSRWLSADTEFDMLDEGAYGTVPVGFSMSDGQVSDFTAGNGKAGYDVATDSYVPEWPHLYLHNIKADADHLGIDLHDLDSWDDTMLMAYCTRRFPRVGLKVLGLLLTGLEW